MGELGDGFLRRVRIHAQLPTQSPDRRKGVASLQTPTRQGLLDRVNKLFRDQLASLLLDFKWEH